MPGNYDLQSLLDVRQNQLGVIFSEGDSIDAKALAILGANIAVLIFINQTSSHLAIWQFLLLYAPFIFSLFLDLISIWPRNYLGMSVDIAAHPEYLGMDTAELVLQLIADTEGAISHNTEINKKRLRFCLLSIILTGLGFLILLCIL